jgi:hypothetical protein
MEELSTMRSSPGHVSTGNVISHSVSNFRGGVHIKHPLQKCADFNSSIANLFVNETPGSRILLTISV